VRLLGIDFGRRRVGLALATDEGRVATPHRTLQVRGRDDALARLVTLIVDEGIDAVVLGLPLTADGEEGTSARRLQRFGEALARRTGRPVYFQDEHLSSVDAAERLRSVGADRPLDEAAAAIILQAYLDALPPSGPAPRPSCG
jgi:putative Holliday junction resolvase